VTLHDPAQCTRQRAWHVTVQLPVDAHIATPRSPTVAVHSPTFVQLTLHVAPQVALQVLERAHVMAHASPHATWQFGPSAHLNVQWSAHLPSQSLPKLAQVGEQDDAVPQSSGHDSAPRQSQDDPVHSGLVEHATTTRANAPAAASARIKALSNTPQDRASRRR
jgi:hypothetical protein